MVKTKSTLAAEGAGFPYVIDDLATPVANPYHSSIDVGGLDFFKDGRIAFCTKSGDIWVGKGLDEKFENIEWKRYASGLFDAHGLKIVDDQVYVLSRNQITRLHDLDSDGEADFYECFNNDVKFSTNFIEIVCGLETDTNGNFYFSQGDPLIMEDNGSGRGHYGSVFRISGSGQKRDVFAFDEISLNGIGIGPNDEISFGQNRSPSTLNAYIRYVKEGDIMDGADLLPRSPAPPLASMPLCWMPRDWSSWHSGQLWVSSDKWGPLRGTMLNFSYCGLSFDSITFPNSVRLFGVVQESVGDARQGGLFRFPLAFSDGIHCARFSPFDGQLYVAGRGFQEPNPRRDGPLQRVRYIGKPVTLANALHVNDKGITIGFTNPVELSSLNNPGNYSIEQFNYRWATDPDPAEYKVSDPTERGHDHFKIQSVRVAPDHKSVFLEIADLRPAMQMKIKMNLKGADGTPLPDEIESTVNVVPKGEVPKWMLNFGVGYQF
jgi:hypothetical protein